MSGPSSCSAVSEAARTFCHTCHHVDAWIGLPRSERKTPVRAHAAAGDVLAQYGHQLSRCRDAPGRLTRPGAVDTDTKMIMPELKIFSRALG